MGPIRYGFDRLASVPRSAYQRAFIGFVLAFILTGVSQRAHAQAQLADDIILLSKGLREQEKARTSTHLGTSPGAGETRFRILPGSAQSQLGEEIRSNSMAARDVLTAASAPPQPSIGSKGPAIILPAIRRPEELPLYGLLEVPVDGEEGPPDGLTLDASIERLMRENFGLRTKFQEIP